MMYRFARSYRDPNFHHVSPRQILVREWSHRDPTTWNLIAKHHNLSLIDVRLVEIWNGERFSEGYLLEFMNENDPMIFKLLM